MAQGGSKKKRRRRGGSGKKKKGGWLIGMRSGFKNVTHSVTGVGDEQAARQTRRSKIISGAITAILILAAALLLYRRFGR